MLITNIPSFLKESYFPLIDIIDMFKFLKKDTTVPFLPM